MRAMAIAAALIVSTAASSDLWAVQEAAPVEGMKMGAGVGFVFTIDLGTAAVEAASPARVAAMAGLVEEAPQEAGGAGEEDVPSEEVEAPAEPAEEVYDDQAYQEEAYDEGAPLEEIEEEQVYDEGAETEAGLEASADEDAVEAEAAEDEAPVDEDEDLEASGVAAVRGSRARP